MTNINIWRTIEDKGLGKLIGIIKRDSGDYHIYEKRVKIIKSIINPEIYSTIISKDKYSLKNNCLVENKEKEEARIYFGKNRFKAFEYFNKIVEEDKKEKSNKIHKTFPKN